MPAAARGNSIDTVASPDGTGVCCALPSTQSTDVCSSTVFYNNIGAVRQHDAMIVHLFDGPCCNPHAPTLPSASPNVFIENKQAGRLGDAYGGDHPISSGSPDVFIN